MTKFTKDTFDEDCPRFIPVKREFTVIKNYSVFDIVDTEKLEIVDFINPYFDVKECKRDCNIMNVIDYLTKEILNDSKTINKKT